ncbi:MAG: sugar ABC transporter permease [candidate division WOR-3 bacterium]|nr:sugar ABC transporter permease [candidate division WOR-3 bacterium]MCX7756720.1 sugar ABC transporter permease [candidate division WOR-3 bacterium]MDW7988446.1 sugar ABC transporter permease [candidate division WOR-3 bacterium]
MNRRLRENLEGYLYLLPALVILLVFRIIPILFSVRISLYDWTMAGPRKFLGFNNYLQVLSDPMFWRSLLNTFWYVIFTVPAMLFLSLFIAVLLNQKIRALGFYRTLYYLPVVTSIVAVSIVWKWLYNPERGLLNYLLSLFNISPIRWLEDPRGIFTILLSPLKINLPDWLSGPSVALCAIIIMSIWKGLGYNIVIFLAGLQNIPVQYYEAAKIDGAGSFRLFRHITWPLLSPTTFYILIMSTIVSFEAFAQVWIMTGPPPGGPLGTTKVVMYYFYEQSFELWRLGYGASIAFIAFLIILILTIIQRQVLERRVQYA